MKETSISVTLAARKFADCVNLVRYKGMSFLLEKNGVPVARLVPVQSDTASGLEQLAETLYSEHKGAFPAHERDQIEKSPSGQRAASEDAKQGEETSIHRKRPTLNW